MRRFALVLPLLVFGCRPVIHVHVHDDDDDDDTDTDTDTGNDSAFTSASGGTSNSGNDSTGD